MQRDSPFTEIGDGAGDRSTATRARHLPATKPPKLSPVRQEQLRRLAVNREPEWAGSPSWLTRTSLSVNARLGSRESRRARPGLVALYYARPGDLGHSVLLPALAGGQWAKDLNVSAPNRRTGVHRWAARSYRAALLVFSGVIGYVFSPGSPPRCAFAGSRPVPSGWHG